MAVRAPPPPPRRRRDASLGQIPLSSGEIELYSRQDEAARRRRRLLAVRDQERRLAQQVTQRYRQNLQRLQRGQRSRRQRQLSAEQRKMLTELHARYQSSLQSMGAAQRNARLKLLELMETAHDERQNWAFNAQIIGKQRVNEAEEDIEQQQQKRAERRRHVEKNVERLKVLTDQQRRQASARARQEQQLKTQRDRDREEVERVRREQSPEEVFVTPRPRGKDVLAYRFTRTHCVAPSVEKETAVTVIRHNRKHPTAVYGEKEAEKYRREMDRKRERDRLVVEQEHETAADRGNDALEDVTSRQQGKQALEWLALVDKMERCARGQDYGGDGVALDARDVDGRGDDPERMAERAFARMLGLDEDSVELSAFSIETDDDRSVGLGDTDHEHSDGDKVAEAAADTDCKQLDEDKAAEANMDHRVKLKAPKRSDYFDPLHDVVPARPDVDTKDTQAGATPAKKAKVASFGDLEGPNEDEDGGEADMHRSSIGSSDAHPWSKAHSN
ncbi:hypothetical protein PF005_g11408 [Phytophthora fragariae]|uniref:Uncharacterized protein n=1 Tax=Phytophthora fragariae TaxID=53985 RepID=A0A6A3Z942_9STRA|nr:hypothetical protein PF007_g5814 [Phytophthora fragariae]KAE9144394.1 hypothetical protein PF006_g10666 [Phytophthora fragariae]KAE9210448.1 hypothetical protein PF005_g11408 [Phytophthora fragariae]KAE9231659.1 hypothetical protein PF002_g12617 [Phytophthora fragariae]